MKQRHLQLAATLLGVALLAACGRQGPTTPPQQAGKGSLEVVLAGVPKAEIMVSGAAGTAFSGDVQGSKTLTLAAGEYLIDGMPRAGALDPTAIRVKVEADRTTQARLVYEALPASSDDATAAVTTLEIIRVLDAHGDALPTAEEENDNKDVMLYAAQTGEPVCVTIRATDGDRLIAGAHVVINVADFTAGPNSENRVAILRGCAETSSVRSVATQDTAISPASFRDGVVTGADGTATFTLYATDGTPTLPNLAKIVVAAETSSSTVLNEFKVFFYNISHLYYFYEGGGEPPQQTPRRVGSRFEEFNIFDPRGASRPGGNPNLFRVITSLFTKQPQLDLPIDTIGYIRYAVEGDEVDIVCDGTLSTDPNNPNIRICTTESGIIELLPKASVKVEDLPIRAKISATLVVVVEYGNSTYEFDLKSYHIEKTWAGSYMRIDKTVDNHVLTWYGENLDPFMDPPSPIGYTLPPANAVPTGSVFTTTVRITATTEGPDPVYNVTIKDALPAELGIIEETFNPSGCTYDSFNHVISCNDQVAQNQPGFDVLNPGESITVSFQVYIRQKPGFCVDNEDFVLSELYRVRWTFASSTQEGLPCYDDPYEVINGAEQQSVNVSWAIGAPVHDGGIQDSASFNGWVYEDQVVIWAVRPIFDVNKVLKNTQDIPFELGIDAHFELTITNLDRTDPVAGGIGYSPAYAALAATFADEFDGSVRDNPYGRDVYLLDGFFPGLDYTSAGLLVVSRDDPPDVGGVDYPAAGFAADFIGFPTLPELFLEEIIDLGDKFILWGPVPLMGGGDSGVARIVLEHVLSGPHINVAVMTAGNMNQGVDLGDCVAQAALTPNVSIAVPTTNNPFSYIADCTTTVVLEPEDPWLELNDVGNTT